MAKHLLLRLYQSKNSAVWSESVTKESCNAADPLDNSTSKRFSGKVLLKTDI